MITWSSSIGEQYEKMKKMSCSAGSQRSVIEFLTLKSEVWLAESIAD